MKIQKFMPDNMPDIVKYQILSFMRIEWSEGFIGHSRNRRWISRPEFNPTHFVMLDQDFVVGHAESLWRDWQHNSVNYRVCGISALFVYPDYRGQGYGKQLVETITEDCATQSNTDIGMLWCEPKLREFYVKCDWKPMDSTVTLLGKEESLAQEHYEEVLFTHFFSEHAKSHHHDFADSNIYFGWTTW